MADPRPRKGAKKQGKRGEIFVWDGNSWKAAGGCSDLFAILVVGGVGLLGIAGATVIKATEVMF